MRKYWWDRLERCKARNKNGFGCNNYARRPYEIEKGNLFIPLTCWIHRNQEKKLRESKV